MIILKRDGTLLVEGAPESSGKRVKAIVKAVEDRVAHQPSLNDRIFAFVLAVLGLQAIDERTQPEQMDKAVGALCNALLVNCGVPKS